MPLSRLNLRSTHYDELIKRSEQAGRQGAGEFGSLMWLLCGYIEIEIWHLRSSSSLWSIINKHVDGAVLSLINCNCTRI